MLYRDITQTRKDLERIFELYSHKAKNKADGTIEKFWELKVSIRFESFERFFGYFL